MAQSSFSKKLTKELTKNPKKTGVLALCLAVAVWFWVPLVWKWMSPEGNGAIPKNSSEAATATAVVAGEPKTADAVATGKTPDINWRKLNDLFSQQPMMASAKLGTGSATPFQRPKKEAVAEIEKESELSEEEHEDIVAPMATPEQLGLSLASTLIGDQISLAMINGQACAVGTVLVVPRGSAAIELTLLEIRSDSVVLKNGQETQELKQATPATDVQLTQAGSETTVHIGPTRRQTTPTRQTPSKEQMLLNSLLGE